MKKSSKRLWAVILAVLMMLTMCYGALAAPADEEDYEDDTAFLDDFVDDYMDEDMFNAVEDVYVVMTTGQIELSPGETTSVSAYVTGEDGTVSYNWSCDNTSVVTVSGKGDTVTVRAIRAGEATITLKASRKSDGDSDSDSVTIVVKADESPVKASVSGTSGVSMKAGESKNFSVKATGGSGRYVYEWETDGSVGVNGGTGPSNTVYARYAGEGSVMCTVYDESDRSNYDVAYWSVNVTEESKKPVTAKLDKTSFNLTAGSATTLTVTASGGSGNYDYYWGNDNPGLVNITGDGEYVTVEAAPVIRADSSRAQVSVTVVDLDTNITSQTLYCVFTVKGEEVYYSAADSASVGTNYPMSSISTDIARAFQSNFGKSLSSSAVVRFENTNDQVGLLRLRDGTVARVGTAYTFAQMQMMYFYPSQSGKFTTGYTLTDGADVISGTITLSCTGGSAITSARLSSDTMNMSAYSSRFLSLAVTPTNASYNVSWSSSNTRVATITGSGNNITVYTQGNTGRSTITATIREANGGVITRTCEIVVSGSGGGGGGGSSMRTYNPSLTITMGSDYYGTTISDSIAKQWRSAFGYILSDNADVGFSTVGNTRYGVMRLRNGRQIQTNQTYSFYDMQEMYFEPYAAGTFNLPYYINYNGSTMSGTISIQIQSSSISTSLEPTSMNMSTYNSRNLYLNVSPSNAYYRVSWSSSNNNIATVSGSGSSVTVKSAGQTGTATITATITDRNGNRVYRNCTVKVTGNSDSSRYDPTVYTTLGVSYTGTGTSDAMFSQFRNVYGSDLNRNAAQIRFSNTGNNSVGVMRLSNGTAVRANTSYSFNDYIAMYTEPISTGTFSIPYTLTYNNRTLSGTVSVVISEGAVNCTLSLPDANPYTFSTGINGASGASQLASAIRNAVGVSWNSISFSTSSDSIGTLYLNSGKAAINSGARISESDMNNLYFVPQRPGTFSANFSVLNASGNKVASGTLRIIVGGDASTFSDVSMNAYYAQAVTWAVQQGVTTGTSNTTFSPASSVTRAQAVTFLWRSRGKPQAGSMNPFSDVAPDEYYTQAVLWAVQQGITTGTSDTTFSPDATLTQDQMITFLCRAEGEFAGGENWSEAAMNWASQRGLFNGMPASPSAKNGCPRSDVVYYLYKDAQ